jgi:hypothetical protein
MAMMVVALLATVVYIVVLGIRQWLQARKLSELAGKRSLRFSRDDPFDLPEALAEFALMKCGHSCRASNVAYGRLDELAVRAFTFRYEVGHGTRRMTRHYGVVVADVARELPELLMWNQHDADHAPADFHQTDRQVDCWTYTGNNVLADIVSDSAGALGEKGLSVQVRGKTVMLALPGRQDYTAWLDPARRLLDAMAADTKIQPEGQDQDHASPLG